MTTKKKLNVPDIGGLLGKISEKREEMPKTPVQSVQPVKEGVAVKSSGEKAVKTLKRKNSNTAKPAEPEVRPRAAGGRPTLKKDSVEYVKVSPRIPKALKKKVDLALVNERFVDQDGTSINTLDEIVAYALEKLLSEG